MSDRVDAGRRIPVALNTGLLAQQALADPIDRPTVDADRRRRHV